MPFQANGVTGKVEGDPVGHCRRYGRMRYFWPSAASIAALYCS
jgi:hypothetical protein